MSEPRTLYLARGTLRVEARGYWYSLGGEKGSFGFCQHLKSTDGKEPFPLFPDTQVHGDLKMAAAWLQKLGPSHDPKFLEKIFGREGSEWSSLLRLTDLELDEPSRAHWSPRRFEVKPRIEIDEATRTVEQNMLVGFEMAYLQGLALEAEIFLGYFGNALELADAKRLVEEAAGFLSGFGAFRSRGCGRGQVAVQWAADETVRWEESSTGLGLCNHRFYLRPLVNLRNRQVEPGKDQLLTSDKWVSSEQLRAWFIRAYHDLFGEWPGLEEMGGLRFPVCYPAFEDGDQRVPGFPPPFSTHRCGDGAVRDSRGELPAASEANDAENFFKPKRRRLRDSEFLTNEPAPRMVKIRAENRMRNSVQPSFAVLKEGGLFAQELVRRGTLLSGSIIVDGIGDAFSRRARFVLENVRPVINGAIFESELAAEPQAFAVAPPGVQMLATEPMTFHPETLGRYGSQVMVGSLRRYNVQLHRPRRNRLVVLPGSIVDAAFEDSRCLEWKGFGAAARLPVSEKLGQIDTAGVASCDVGAVEWKLVEGMSRAQFGQIREFMSMPTEVAKKKIDSILAKYAGWNKKTIDTHLIPKEILEELLRLLESPPRELRSYIGRLSECYVAWLWNGSKEKTKSLKEKALDELKNEKAKRNAHP